MAFDPAALTRDIKTAAEMLERLDPKSEALRKAAVMKARAGLPVGSSNLPAGEDENPVGSRRGRKGREGNIPPNPPRGASVDLPDWNGPDEVRAVIRKHLGDDADGHLRSCGWRDVPERALVARSSTMLAKLKSCAVELEAAGVRLILEKGRAA
jgi:hypothetical protein